MVARYQRKEKRFDAFEGRSIYSAGNANGYLVARDFVALSKMKKDKKTQHPKLMLTLLFVKVVMPPTINAFAYEPESLVQLRATHQLIRMPESAIKAPFAALCRSPTFHLSGCICV